MNSKKSNFEKDGSPFVLCNKCGLKFSRKENLVFHMRHECGRYYVCVCGTKCQRKCSLMRHMKSKHPNEQHLYETMYVVENVNASEIPRRYPTGF